MELIHKQPVRWTKERVVSCDGGGGPLGHPRIFINTDKPEICECTYCGLPFVCLSTSIMLELRVPVTILTRHRPMSTTEHIWSLSHRHPTRLVPKATQPKCKNLRGSQTSHWASGKERVCLTWVVSVYIAARKQFLQSHCIPQIRPSLPITRITSLPLPKTSTILHKPAPPAAQQTTLA
jgi:uncharacterized Zn-finger protein